MQGGGRSGRRSKTLSPNNEKIITGGNLTAESEITATRQERLLATEAGSGPSPSLDAPEIGACTESSRPLSKAGLAHSFPRFACLLQPFSALRTSSRGFIPQESRRSAA